MIWFDWPAKCQVIFGGGLEPITSQPNSASVPALKSDCGDLERMWAISGLTVRRLIEARSAERARGFSADFGRFWQILGRFLIIEIDPAQVTGEGERSKEED